MNANAKGCNLSKARTTRTIRLAPTTRAIRAALAVSATVLALSGSGVAMAGSCSYSLTTNTESCDGAFTNLPGGSFVPVTDLTLILGDSLPTSVTPANGVIGVDASWAGDIGVINHADITTARADGIREYGAVATLINYGNIATDVSTGGFYTKAVAIKVGGDATVINDGDIFAFNSSVYNAGALSVFSSTGDISIDNHSAGSLTANAGTSGNAFALTARADGLAGDITINQSGLIQAGSIQGNATGILATAHGDNSDVDITLAATSAINAQSSYGGSAVGINANNSGSYGELSIDNSGEINATDAFGRNSAIGITSLSYSETTDTTVTNSGDVAADGGFAIGVAVVAGRDYSNYYAVPSAAVSLSNAVTGSISATGNYLATGIYSIGASVVSVIDNAGDITASAASGLDDFTVNVRANGVIAASQGDLSISNNGTIYVSAASAGNYASAAANGVRAYASDIAITNSGHITVDAEVTEGSWNSATATGVYARGNSIEFVSGIGSSLDVTAVAFQPQDFAMGVELYGTSTSISAAGEIAATASANPLSGFAGATGMLGFGSDSANIVTVGGSSISASATGYTVFATGIAAQGNNHLTLDNAGDIDVLATAVNGKATGLWGFSYGDIAATNSGDVVAEFVGANGTAYGARMTSTGDDVTFTNSGDITAVGNDATGIDAYAGGLLSVTNTDTGSVTVTGDRSATGIVALGQTGATVNNSGNIAVEGFWNAYGICASACYGDASGLSSVTNASTGNIMVTAYGRAVGVIAHGDSAASVDNFGNIAASATVGYAVGILAPSRYGSATVTNAATGSIVVNGGYGATGIAAFGDTVSSVVNDGDVSATAIASLHRANGHVNANGIVGYVGEVSNQGNITVVAANIPNDPFGFSFEDIIANGVSISSIGDGSVDNSGNIAVTANNGPNNYVGGYAFATGVRIYSANSTVTNSGSISATAYGDTNGTATAIISHGFVGGSDSSITASASAGVRAYATGIEARGAADIDIGGVFAVSASALGFAIANGVENTGGGSSQISTDAGSLITVNASAPGALAGGLVIDAGSLALDNAGDLSVLATGYDGGAWGIFADVSGAVTASNSGNITAEFAGESGMAYGVLISSSDAVTLTNAGHITATNADRAVGVELDGGAGTTLINSGTITAIAAHTGGIAVLTGNAADAIDNSGTINGEVWTGAAGDTFVNSAGGLWHAIGNSGFGDGDDLLSNAGTIFLDNAAIFMGSSDTGDQFTNAGLIFVSGDSLIDMGTGTVADAGADSNALVPSLNPNAFYNNGIISFVDGAANDTLTITGDFAGDGVINMDVSPLNNTNDLLNIDGSVVDGSVNTINVNVIAAPTAAFTDVPLVRVSGDSATGDFVLGAINFSRNRFLTQDLSLISSIDPTNVAVDVFSLTIDVTGLSGAGALGASIAPGAQSLMNSQVGTWRQRMGVIDKSVAGKPSLWARTFQDSGTIAPDAVAGNFGSGGNLAFDQRNSGTEVGADFALSDKLSVGLLLAKVDGSQHLNGTGEDKLHGETRGLYATWISPTGFYLDASYRWMNFDARQSSAAGEMHTHGEADALNLELGYAWTLANGVKIEPQFQHTRTTVSNVDALSIGSSTFQSKGGGASRDRLGVMIRKSFGSNGTVWTPYASINAVHGSDGEAAYSVNNTFFGATSTGGTSALVEGGLSVQIGHLSIFGGANWQDGGALRSFSGGQLGLRYNW